MKTVFVLLLLTSCSAVSNTLGEAGKSPGEIACEGTATISGSGNIAATLGINASNEFRLSFDCGRGAFIRQGMPVP